MRTTTLIGVAFVVVLCPLTRVLAQTPVSDTANPASENRAGWSLGLGAGLGAHGPAGQLSLGIPAGPGELVVRSAGTAEVFLLFSGPPESVGDLAILYGRRIGGRKGWVRFAAGPGYVESVRRGEIAECFLIFCDYEQHTTHSLGLAAQADGVWAIARWFGLGVSLFGNVNGESSFTGASLGVYFGSLR